MSPPETPRKIAVSLSGGGITGAMFEVGCLAAIEDESRAFASRGFDVYVGSGSGATVAAALAGGISALRLYRALLDPADVFFPLQRHHLIRFDLGEWRRVLGTAFSAARRSVSSVSSRPLETDVWNELDRFWDSLPAGAFTLEAYERFFSDFLARRGVSERFSDLPRALRLVAYDVDRGERVVFGEPPLTQVPISRAVCAASAIPVLYAPVRIEGRDFVDGGLGETAQADVALSLGCDFLLVVNPLVPVIADPSSPSIPTGHGRMSRVRDKGFLWIYEQAWRARNQEQLRAGLARFHAAHPELEVATLEPSGDDATMFMHSPMNFAARREILEYGYHTTKALLASSRSSLARIIRGHE